jgi:uncharacterized protein
MEHYNATANALHAGHYTPVFEIDTRHDEVLWELWIAGFETAMQLRPDGWAMLLQSGKETRVALLASSPSQRLIAVTVASLRATSST